MNKQVKALYKSFETMTDKQILSFLGMYFNKAGLENMTTYFALDGLAEEENPDKEDIKKIKSIISLAKKLK